MTAFTEYSAITKAERADMCPAIEAILQEGFQKGYPQGVTIATTRHIQALMRNPGISAARAMDMIGLSPEDRASYAALIMP